MRLLSVARERLYTSVTNRFPYAAYHVLNYVAFHGFIYNKHKRYECVHCGDLFDNWGRNHGRACVQPEDLSNLVEHADSHLYCGKSRLPFEEIAVLMPNPEVFCHFFNTSCWDQNTYMTIALKKLAEDAAIRERSFHDNPAAVASLHPEESIEDCVTRGLWYNATRREIQCAFCTYTTNVLGILHKESHADLTRCPRLIDCAARPSNNLQTRDLLGNTGERKQGLNGVDATPEQRQAKLLLELEVQLAQSCASSDIFMHQASGMNDYWEASENGAATRHQAAAAYGSVAATGGNATTASGGAAAASGGAAAATDDESTPPPNEMWSTPPRSPASYYPSTVGRGGISHYTAPGDRGAGQRRLSGRPYNACAARVYYKPDVVTPPRPNWARRMSAVERARVAPIRGVATRAMALNAATRQAVVSQQAQATNSTRLHAAQAENSSAPLRLDLSAVAPTSPQQQVTASTCCAAQLDPQMHAFGVGGGQHQAVAPVANTHGGMLEVWRRLATEGYTTDQVLELLGKRTDERLDTYDEFKVFEHKVRGQDFLTLGPAERKCVVCLRSPATTAADPCGHMYYCVACLKRLRYCCICQRRISRRLRVFSPYS